MNKHVEKAMEIRNETPMVNNCAQTILRAYADELGITGDMAAKLSANFGGGMKCGSTCGAITGGLMVLGALGVENPYVINQFRRSADLLKANAQKGGIKKVHCDGMIREAIELIDELVKSE